ncbi:MAG: hypothetical protein KMY55_00440 [Dethiosulfatibacter sp.]|nr:hypothetical protein [Dethiosulfatibacter sp.]
MNKKLRIIVPIYKFGKSGGDRVLLKLADGWIEQGHIVDFVTSMNPQELYYPTRANIIALSKINKAKSIKQNQVQITGEAVSKAF